MGKRTVTIIECDCCTSRHPSADTYAAAVADGWRVRLNRALCPECKTGNSIGIDGAVTETRTR